MRIGMCWSRPIFSRIICPRSFVTVCASKGQTRRFVSLTASRFPTRTSCGRSKSKKTMDLPSPPRKAGARPSPTRWRQNSTPRRTCATWTAKASTSSVLFPTLGLYIMWRSNLDPELSAAICRAYNSWLADYCSYDRKRLHGVALIPLQDPQRAVEELKYAKEKLGLVGIFWRPNKFCGRTLASPDYFPVYEVAADLGVPLCIHEGARTVLEQAGSDRYSEFGRHIACHPLEQMLACLNFCADGVLEKFPKLKVAHLESGCGWVPFWLERMDEHWEHEGQGRAKVTKEKPSYYFKRQCWASCEAGEELAPAFVEHVGEDYLTIATDYPHSDCIGKFPDRTVGDLTSNHHLSTEAKQKILWDNPVRLYGLNVN